MKRTGVFAQPVVDQFGVRLLQKWYDIGTRLFMGWASIKNTSGKDPVKDRAAQLEWRAAVRALGKDAVYVDYPLPDWRTAPMPNDISDMVTDQQCIGFMAPDEFNRKRADNKTFVVTPDGWAAYWDAIENVTNLMSRPPMVHVGDYAGALLSAAWGAYTGADMKPFDARLTHGCTNWHPRNVYGSARPDCDDYPSRAVRMLRQIAPKKPRWYISECANEKLNKTGGRAPTAAELEAQYKAVMAEDTADAPIEAWLWFPQEPHAGPNHIFDATTPEQFEVVKAINSKFAPPPSNADVLAEALEKLNAQAKRIDALDADLRAANRLAKTAHERIDAADALLQKIRDL